MIIEKNLLKNINFLIYKKKHLIIYIFIGILSLVVELSIRKLLINSYPNQNFLHHFSLLAGIFFAFYFNIKFNFNVPKIYLKRSLLYFFIISFSSYFFQVYTKSFLNLKNFNFEESRFFISGIFFLIAYFFHIKFSFKHNRKVGVAIYANGYEDIKKIHDKIGLYPDFIHIDVIDKSMNVNSSDFNLSKLEAVKAYWPNHEIHTHVMSKNPLKLIDDSILKFSDIIYFHHEVEDKKDDIINKIKKHNKTPGLVLHAINNYTEITKVVESFSEILILSIDKPGNSGQQFNLQALNLIEKINQISSRKNFKLCVDGGIKSNLLSKFSSEKVVSGSDVLNNDNPKKQIMRLQTLSRYEK